MPMQLTGGVGSTNVTSYADVEIHILATPPFAFPVYAGFTPGMNQQGIGLLGQSGFFDKFRVGFDHKAKLFHIDVP